MHIYTEKKNRTDRRDRQCTRTSTYMYIYKKKIKHQKDTHSMPCGLYVNNVYKTSVLCRPPPPPC